MSHYAVTLRYAREAATSPQDVCVKTACLITVYMLVHNLLVIYPLFKLSDEVSGFGLTYYGAENILCVESGFNRAGVGIGDFCLALAVSAKGSKG